MSNKKGFTLIEIIVVLIITGILAAAAVPSYFSYMQQAASTSAQNNLTSIYNAQKSLYFSSGNYYISAACPDSLANLNAGLSLNITDSNFNYCCSNTGGFQCTATSSAGSGITLTLKNNSIVLLGGSGCATTSGASCNPGCAPAASSLCPNN